VGEVSHLEGEQIPKMKRREFITTLGAATAAALASRIPVAHAQQSPGKVSRVAYLYPGFLDNRGDRELFDAFRTELRQRGFIEGRNLVIDARSADGDVERVPVFAAELVALRPDAIVATGLPTVAAARRITSTIPIVMCPGGEPVGSGLIQSLAHPGGNITGLADLNDDTMGKLIELIHIVLPDAKRIAVLTSSNPNHPRRYQLCEAAAKSLGLSAVQVSAPTDASLDRAFEMMTQENCDALFVLNDATRPAIVTLAAKARMPAFFLFAGYVELGGLASYGASLIPMWRKAADYVDKILKGANPAELPVEQPVIFELTLNLKTAKALGLTFSDTLLARADKVIE
jgi:putative ABC transport system substrate-binding protein